MQLTAEDERDTLEAAAAPHKEYCQRQLLSWRCE